MSSEPELDYRMGEPFTHDGRIIKPESLQEAKIIRLTDPMWRMNNLYRILNEDGSDVVFQLRPLQKKLVQQFWFRNLVLKARQLGITTVILLWMLDKVLTVKNLRAVLIAHKLEDATALLREKVEYPYANLPMEIHNTVKIVSKNSQEISFSNGSRIKVTTSGRSGTCNLLHVTEFGRLVADDPAKAKEVISGSLPAVHQKGRIWIESTAEGTTGDFADMSKKSLNLKLEGRKLTNLDFKFHFIPWFARGENSLPLEQAEHVPISRTMHAYLAKVEAEDSPRPLSLEQKAWYQVTSDGLDELMKREHPSNPEEAFESSGEGLWFKLAMTRVREQKRLIHEGIPVLYGRSVTPYWDIGVGDAAACWFIQDVGEWRHVLGYFESTDHGMDTYIPLVYQMAKEQGWSLAPKWVGPHDMMQRSKGQAKTLVQECKEYGANFMVVPRVSQKIISIQSARRFIDTLKFDMTGPNMELAVARLDGYKKKRNKQTNEWIEEPAKDGNDHGADALQCAAMATDPSSGYQHRNTNAAATGLTLEQRKADPYGDKGGAPQASPRSLRAHTL